MPDRTYRVKIEGLPELRVTVSEDSPALMPVPVPEPPPIPPPPVPPPEPPTSPTAVGRAVLRRSDLTYLGAFNPPYAAFGSLTGGAYSETKYSAGGLTFRRVGGERRLFGTGHPYTGGLVYEMDVPDPVLPSGDPTDPASYPSAKVVREWGDIYGGRKVIRYRDATLAIPDYPLYDKAGSNNGVPTWGLYWDEPTQRLYWSYAHYYGGEIQTPTLGYSTLDEATGKATGHGPWRTLVYSKNSVGSRLNHYRTRGGFLRVPDDFASKYAGGRTLGVFGGGIYGAGGGYDSLGPVLTLVDPAAMDDANVASPLDQVSGILDPVNLLDYGWNYYPSTEDPIPARRDPDYEAGFPATALGGTDRTAIVRTAGSLPFYPPGVAHAPEYLGEPITFTFNDGSIQARTVAFYTAGVNPGEAVFTLDSPLSSGKAVETGTKMHIHFTKSGGGAVTKPGKDGVGYWTMQDMPGAAVWIDGPEKHGLMYFPTLASGWMAYRGGGPQVESIYNEMWIYDPADLAWIASGGIDRSQVDPAERSRWQMPGRPMPIPNAFLKSIAHGACFDPVDKRLYVLVSRSLGSSVGSPGDRPAIHAFSVDC